MNSRLRFAGRLAFEVVALVALLGFLAAVLVLQLVTAGRLPR